MSQQVLVEKPPQKEILDYPNLQKVKKAAVLFVNFSMALLITFIILRIAEFSLILLNNDLPEESFKLIAQALLSDAIFYLKVSIILFLPFVVIFFLSESTNISFWIFGITGSIIVLIYITLIKYFGTALVPLGADVFGYSILEIRQTVSGANFVDVISIGLLVIPLACFWLLLSFFSSRRLVTSTFAYSILGVGACLAYFGISALPSTAAFKNDFAYNLSLNKAAFFTEQSMAYFSEDESNSIEDVDALIVEQSKSLAGFKPFKYVDPEYPFLREEDAEDVLGNFFATDSVIKPNFVFIQVEGLGRAFSGKHAYLKSFTPFLDELADKGLYWENFLASQGRTFASLPSVLASLPFGERGFSDLGAQMPSHFSFINILNSNGYQSRYYGGFEMGFDNQGLFMKNTGNKLIVSSEDFDHGIEKGSSWGYADRDLMKKFLDVEAKSSSEPFIAYLETISMHTPYTVPNQPGYISKFKEHMKLVGIENSKQASYSQYEDIYSSIMYTDDAIRYLFTEYAKLPTFKNTIFIITGDHRLPEIPIATKLDRYHVPLIIYSPMLKRTASFKSISSHLDITPSLVAFVKNNFGVTSPSKVAWVGSGLDTAASLRNIHKYPLKQTTSSLHNFISGLHFIDQDQLFTIGENLDLNPIQNTSVSKQLQSEFGEYNSRNNRFKRNLKLIPNDLYNQFVLK